MNKGEFMKSLSIFDVQNINTTLKDKQIPYTLKLKDVCGSQSLTFIGDDTTITSEYLCDIANLILKEKYIELYPSSINPYNILIR